MLRRQTTDSLQRSQSEMQVQGHITERAYQFQPNSCSQNNRHKLTKESQYQNFNYKYKN